MLLFSTSLSITDRLTPDRFIELVVDWNNGSNRPENIIPDVRWNGERNIRYGKDDLWMEIMEDAANDTIAVRYEKRSGDGRIWDSDYVVNFRERKICIRLDRSYADDALVTDPGFSTPHIITMLIERGYLEEDAGLKILRDPIPVGAGDADWLTGIFRGKKEYHLPIVYVSRKRSGQPALDVNWLAGRLKGAAHVLVADSPECDRVFFEKCRPEVESGGSIGIYYLSGVKRHKGFKSEKYDKRPDLLLDRVVNHVISYAKTQKEDDRYTWDGVRRAVLQERIEQLRVERLRLEEEKQNALSRGEEAESFADQLASAFDDEIASLQAQAEQYRNQAEALQAENMGLRSKMNGLASLPLLYMGDEKDLYEGEVRDIVLSVLIEARKNVSENSRRADILDDIISANEYKGHSAARAKRIRTMFKGYRNMSSAMRQELEAMGMVINQDGSHYKLKYYGDERYVSVIAKSGSDHREGENTSHQIIRDML